ncbi:MAG: mercury methylation corrinoid protein HgcA [bacterium]|nr:mercury methylation corrinoid protein HgcA [bacterium]
MSQTCCPSRPERCCPDTKTEIPFVRVPVKVEDLPSSVTGEVQSAIGSIPRVTSELTFADQLGMWKARWGISRMDYTVYPGLYAVGDPGPDSEVLVTANYRMTFDLLRRAVSGLDLWVLVLDTKGINVWCAAGKGTFGTDELVRRIESAGLRSVVNHRRIIVPQLGAVGVAAHKVKDITGFRVIYGPVEMTDLKPFFASGRRATPAMRKKQFPLSERAAIAPMELIPAAKWVVAFTFVLATVAGLAGPGSLLDDAARFGLEAFLLLSLAVVSGAILAPLFLPWLPGRAFAIKGAVTGAAVSFMLPLASSFPATRLAAWSLIIVALSSFLAMNFTGSSTYTSLSGVKKEMKEAVPFQAGAGTVGLLLWVVSLIKAGGGA